MKLGKITTYCVALILTSAINNSAFGGVSGAASVSEDLNNFFDTLGYAGNVNKPTSYQGQAAGYYSGGSMVLRSKVRNIQIMHIDLPAARAGCGGIDLFNGGASFVNAKDLTTFFQNVMSSASGYMFNLALETVVPEIAHSMQYIQKLAQDINSNNFNSCEMAESLIGGALPKMEATQRHICKSITGNRNKVSDWAEARQKCSEEVWSKEAMNKAAEHPDYKRQIILNKNLIWDAIAKIAFLNTKELKEFFMSLSGTIVFDANGKAKIYPPLAKDQDIIKALLEGGKAIIYKCDTADKCISPMEAGINIDKEQALYHKINDSINQIVTALVSDQGKLPPKLQGFLDLTKLPIFRFVTAHLMAGNAAMALSITNYSESIAKTLLMQYMHEALQVVEKSLSGTDYAPEIHKQLIDQIHQALIYVENIKTQSRHDIQELMSFVDSSKQTERETMSKVTGQLKNTAGGK